MANNDNVMARFLFAILEQKCLKDVDWNKVARNPVLAQPITNGHAARMRFSRFKSGVLGLEPQRRNKSRVTKKKKDDAPTIPKKEDEDEKSSGSGIGNIKTEIKRGSASPKIKPERKSISLQLPQPSQPSEPSQASQPPASMTTTPAAMKTEPGLASNPHNQDQHQHLRHPSIISIASPQIKSEHVPTPMAKAMPEPAPFGTNPSDTQIPTRAPSTSSTAFTDNYHRMQMRLPTPSSDSDGLPGFLRHSSPPASDFLHSQHHHQHQHHHHQHYPLVGAGSPPLSTTASSPYDFSQCMELGTPAAAGSPSPWHSQHHHHHNSQSLGHTHNHAHTPHHSQVGSMFSPAFDIGIGLGVAPSSTTTPGGNTTSATTGNGYTLDTVGTYNNNLNLIACGPHRDRSQHHHPHHSHHNFAHQHHHQHHQQNSTHGCTDEDGHHEVDALGLHVGGGGSMFREREIELEMAGHGHSHGQGLGLGLGISGVRGVEDSQQWEGASSYDI